MARFVDPAWVAERLENPDFLVLDPRRPMKYLSGHLKNAVNLPTFKAFDEQLRLLSPDSLASWIGSAGLDENRTPILYDSFDGQNAAMLTWILEYLGRTDVHVMNVFYESWIGQKREVFYKPVEATPGAFQHKEDPTIRITADEIRNNPTFKLLDTRSPEEFSGTRDLDGKPGHIPGARNLVWRDLTGAPESFLALNGRLAELFEKAGLKPGDRVVSYCRSGLRASIAYLALRDLGYNVTLYDGSYRDWVGRGLPVEV